MLQPYEIELARNQGWQLVEVFDPRTRRLTVQIHPVKFAPPFTHVELAGSWVVNRARSGDTLAKKALKFVIQGTRS
jgi:hypothetical protein